MKHRKITYIAQGVAAILLVIASGMKFIGHEHSIAIFEALEMEPNGRYIIAIIELGAAILLLSSYAGVGSVLAVGVMFGAVIAHLTKLGLVVNDDGGLLVGMLLVVFVCAGYVMVSRRREIPMVGGSQR